jgi:hypothetical protein
MSLASLPPSVLLSIFSHLTSEEQVPLRLVSKGFNKLLNRRAVLQTGKTEKRRIATRESVRESARRASAIETRLSAAASSGGGSNPSAAIDSPSTSSLCATANIHNRLNAPSKQAVGDNFRRYLNVRPNSRSPKRVEVDDSLKVLLRNVKVLPSSLFRWKPDTTKDGLISVCKHHRFNWFVEV